MGHAAEPQSRTYCSCNTASTGIAGAHLPWFDVRQAPADKGSALCGEKQTSAAGYSKRSDADGTLNRLVGESGARAVHTETSSEI